MISPYTTPGSRVVCLYNSPERTLEDLKPEYRHVYTGSRTLAEDTYVVGGVYVLRAVVPHSATNCGFAAQLEERDGYYTLESLGLYELSGSLTGPPTETGTEVGS